MGIYIRRVKNKEGKVAEYYCIDYVVSGKRKYETVGKKGLISKYQARELLTERKRQIRLGQLGLTKTTIPTLNAFISEYTVYSRDIKRNREWEGATCAIKVFARYYGDKKLSEITPAEIDDYKRIRLGDGRKPAPVNHELSYLNSLFNLARKRKKYFNPITPVSEAGLLAVDNRRERVLTPQEEERLLDRCPDFFRPLVVTALKTGMRRNELKLLKWEDVDFKNNLITIPQANSKNKKQRRIPISAALKKVLLEQKLRSVSEYVFERFAGKSKALINRYFEKACRKAGIQGLRFHNLRHTAATRMLEGGAKIQGVSKMLGHSSWNITMRYSHPDDSLKEAAEILGNFCSNVDKNVDMEQVDDSK